LLFIQNYTKRHLSTSCTFPADGSVVFICDCENTFSAAVKQFLWDALPDVTDKVLTLVREQLH